MLIFQKQTLTFNKCSQIDYKKYRKSIEYTNIKMYMYFVFIVHTLKY